MTSPLFLLEDGALAGAGPGARVILDGPEGRHAGSVRRVTAGERVDVADGSGAVACCEVVASGRDRLELRVLTVHVEPEPASRLVLVQALAKGGRDELAVETATELGVDVVVPWQAARSVVVWRGTRGMRGRERWVATARAAAKQSRRARVPEVAAVAGRDEVVARLREAALALVLQENADAPLSKVEPPAAGDVVVVVGPEGGLDPAELAAFTGAGARAVRLGPHVLRSSSAGPVALAVLAVRSGRWDSAPGVSGR